MARAGRALTLGTMIGRNVVTADGARVGTVLDVRARSVTTDEDPAPVVRALVVGRTRLGARLGYDRTQGQGPWLLRIAVRALHRSSRLVAWDGIDAVDLGDRLARGGPVRLRLDLAAFEQLAPEEVERRDR